MKVILTVVILAVCTFSLFLLWKPTEPVRIGIRSYYAKDRYLIAYVHGEYFGDFFVPQMDIFRYLNQEQINNIVLTETIPGRR